MSILLAKHLESISKSVESAREDLDAASVDVATALAVLSKTTGNKPVEVAIQDAIYWLERGSATHALEIFKAAIQYGYKRYIAAMQ
jgi:hypothetical protein